MLSEPIEKDRRCWRRVGLRRSRIRTISGRATQLQTSAPGSTGTTIARRQWHVFAATTGAVEVIWHSIALASLCRSLLPSLIGAKMSVADVLIQVPSLEFTPKAIRAER
jgi:hypothetical protein